MELPKQLVEVPRPPLLPISLERLTALTAKLAAGCPLPWLDIEDADVGEAELLKFNGVVEYLCALLGAAEFLRIKIGQVMADRMTVDQQGRCLTLLGDAAHLAAREAPDAVVDALVDTPVDGKDIDQPAD